MFYGVWNPYSDQFTFEEDLIEFLLGNNLLSEDAFIEVRQFTWTWEMWFRN